MNLEAREGRRDWRPWKFNGFNESRGKAEGATRQLSRGSADGSRGRPGSAGGGCGA
ncbi:MAG: hypothetical protein LBU32_32675 [Clostridiales bacterium]|nr:hypothetical protein [Clostridiales bacterium]